MTKSIKTIKTCDACNGTGYKTDPLNGYPLDCPDCEGKGFMLIEESQTKKKED